VTIDYEPGRNLAIMIIVYIIVGIGAAFVAYGGWSLR
jgi:hypothetical protein